MIRLGFDFEQLAKETKDVLSGIQEEISEVKRESGALRTEVGQHMAKLDKSTKQQQDLPGELRKEMADFKNSTLSQMQEIVDSTPTVWFISKDPTDHSHASYQVIIFGAVVENVGGGYNSTTGKFTAPVQGLYTFTLHICGYGTNYMNYAIMHDDNPLLKGRDYESGGIGFPCTSATAYTYMDAGDKVWITVWGGGSFQQIHVGNGNCWNTCTGALVSKLQY